MDAWDDSPALPIPLDILLDIVAHLPLNAVLVLRRTCRALRAVTLLRTLWVLLFRTHVLEQRIPYPNTPLADLSAQGLEDLVRRALTLRRTWTSPHPAPCRHLIFNASSQPRTRVIFLQFLPGRSNRWLISVCMTAQPRAYLLQCWDVAPDCPSYVAELRHADGPYGGVVLNSDPTSSAVLAMQSAQTETFSVDFDAQDPECGFETEATIDGMRELNLLSGDTLVTRRLDDGGALSLWDLADLRQEKVQLLNPSLEKPDDRVQSIHLAHDYAVVVRIQSVEIYSIVPRPNLLPGHGPPIAYPLAQSKFQWRTDTVVLCQQTVTVATSGSVVPPPIHLLVRFCSIYPWPVNVLHHYHLRPNPNFSAGGHSRGRTPIPPSSGGRTIPSSPRAHAHPYTHARAHSHAHIPPARAVTSEYNLPYDPRPYPTHTVGSPVRLFGQSAMALGRYGTALWLDNHTEEWLGPSERGQRLAGNVIRLDHWASNSEGGSGGGMTITTVAEPTASQSRNTSMIFGMHNDDVWTRVAMEEEAGRIALGHTDGAITLLEY